MLNLRVRRKWKNAIMLGLCSLLAFFIFTVLAWILIHLFHKGMHGLSWHSLSHMTQSPNSQGGLLNAIIGSLVMTISALIIGSPIGVMIGLYLAEFHKRGLFSNSIRFIIDILLGTPGIILGLYIYTIFVLPYGHFSAWAGALALAMIVIPMIAKITESVYLLVPNVLKESILSLGAHPWRLYFHIIMKVIHLSLLTGLLLVFSRIMGEAAPLIFTALSNQFWSLNMNQPMASLPILIFNYAMSPYANWQELAWNAAFLMTLFVLSINILSRYLIQIASKSQTRG